MPRPTLRTLAGAAGLSAMTVSRALRNHPQVAGPTRQRIQALAAKLGYRPDPTVAMLMHHLRSRTKPVFQASLCALTDVEPGAHHPYMDKVLFGARRRAEQLGYRLDLIHLQEMSRSPRQLQRILRSRGIQGLVLLPMSASVRLDALLDWREFSVVAATGSVVAPVFRRVVPSHFANTIELCHQLAARGYRRIGLALDSTQDSRVNHVFSAACTWHGIFEGSGLIPPFFYEGAMPVELRAWFKRERPDAVVLGRDELMPSFTEILGQPPRRQPGLASTYAAPESGATGIDELPDEIGTLAVEILSGMTQRGEKGPPPVPTALTVTGRWLGGRTCPRRGRAAPALSGASAPR